MKRFLIAALAILVFGLISFWVYIAYLAPVKGLPPNFCGYWSPFSNDDPTCECDGTIMRKGGPTGPSDDSGGYYECVGKVITDQ